MGLEHTTLPMSALCSADLANGPLDTNVLQINSFYVVNVRKLIKKRK